MKNSINEDYGGFLIISPLSTTRNFRQTAVNQ